MPWENKTKAEILRGADQNYIRAKKVARNTVNILYHDRVVTRYHSTNVVTQYADGLTIFDSGGYHTMTTKRRIEEFGEIRLGTRRDRNDRHGVSFWVLPDGRRFEDGIMWRADPILEFDEYEDSIE
jgi:hypothetical protein